MQIVFFLIISMGAGGHSGGTALIPAHYTSYEVCMAAGTDARENMDGAGRLSFTCVPAEPNLETEE